MRARILAFVRRLRRDEIDVSVAEARDAVAAVAAAGLEREVLRDALRATLLKQEADRPLFDALFDACFPLVGAGGKRAARGRRGAPRSDGAGEDGGGGRGAGGRGAARGAPTAGRTPGATPATVPARTTAARAAGEQPMRGGERREADERAGVPGERGAAGRRRRLLALPLHEFTARDVAEARALARELGNRLRGRLARRRRGARRGTLDFRRTMRAATSTGGVPLRLARRARRPGRPDLVALCDLSGSVAAASELLLGLVAPAADYFRRAHLFAYVDRLCPVSIEDGHVAPGALLDLHARSDFGHVLADLLGATAPPLGKSTVVLVLGDARNNRRPARADLLRAVRARVQRLVWLVPEPRARWNTGDSVLGLYAPACDLVVECLDLGALVRAVRRVF